jgi:hypothetical protein
LHLKAAQVATPVRDKRVSMELRTRTMRVEGRRFDFHEKAAGQYPAASRAQNACFRK